MNQSTGPSLHRLRGDIVVLLSCVCAMLILDGLRHYVFFRDYAITFEGAYRLYLGQIPYRDFGTPVGPVSFLIPALFFQLFGPTWSAFHASQLFQNAVLLILIYGILRKLQVRPLVTWLSLASYTFFALVFLTHPWYNISGFMFLAVSAWLALGANGASAAWAGAMTGLCILAKQDFGVLSFGISAVLVAHRSLCPTALEPNSAPAHLLYPLPLKRTAGRLIVFGLTAAAMVTAFALLTDAQSFQYWFNYGQAPHQLRGLTTKDLLGNSFGTLGLITGAIGLWKNNLKLLLGSMLVTAASVTRTTSGLAFTHYYFVAFIPVIVDELFTLKIRLKPLLLVLIVYTSYRVMIRPANDLARVVESIAVRQPEHFFFDYRMLTAPTTPFSQDLPSFSPQTQAPQETIEALRALKIELESKGGRGRSTSAEDRVLNLTELTPVYPETLAVPPRHFPLWFHEKITVFPKEEEQLKKEVAGDRFDAILVQGTALPRLHRELLSILDQNTNYRKFCTVQNTPATATGPCRNGCDEYIHIYVKK